MRFLPFVLKHLRRTWIRTTSTVLAMAVCVSLFCTLQAVLARLGAMVESRSLNRLVTQNAVSFIFPMPLSYAKEIGKIPGVKRVAAVSIFGGLLTGKKEGRAEAGAGATTDWTDYFPNAAVEAEPYFAMNPEFVIPPGDLRAFLGDLEGCVIGRELADKFGWRVGDRFFLESFVPAFRRPAGPFEFVVRGILDADFERYPGTDTNVMFFHFRYLDEGIGGLRGTGMYWVEIADPEQGAEIGAAIDALFENSAAQTYTATERAFFASAMSLAGNLAWLLNGIGTAVAFTILLVTANTMSMAVRERRTEIAVLKTIGFSSGRVMALVVSEALLLGALGGALGVAGTLGLLWALNHMRSSMYLPISGLALDPRMALVGFGFALLLGFAAGFMPAWGSYRARVTDMLRTV